jgi:ectoine hydroxylase-related dioxygenase (phytanoyl-CoA dioxygenase family)
MTDGDELPRFARPYDWAQIDSVVQTMGGAIVEDMLTSSEIESLNDQVDESLALHGDIANAATGSGSYDTFLGHKTLRLHGLLEKAPASAKLIGRAELVEWAERMIAPVASSVLLNAGELIQIQPGEPAQYLHRDTDSWPIPIGPHPLLVNAIVALDPCTLENGATYVAPTSWQWEPRRKPQEGELSRAIMKPGDALLFRGDLVHGGGENRTDSRRRVLSISYCAGWLRPVENSFLNLSRETVRPLTPKLQALLGYAPYDGTEQLGGMIGLYENGDPARALESDRSTH